jgi:hypothetical protein
MIHSASIQACRPSRHWKALAQNQRAFQEKSFQSKKDRGETDPQGSLAFERERERRERQRLKEEAAAEKIRARREAAMSKAEATLETATREHVAMSAQIEEDSVALDQRADAEESRWHEQLERLGRSVEGEPVTHEAFSSKCRRKLSLNAKDLQAEAEVFTVRRGTFASDKFHSAMVCFPARRDALSRSKFLRKASSPFLRVARLISASLRACPFSPHALCVCTVSCLVNTGVRPLLNA